jgi:hypothetical protein
MKLPKNIPKTADFISDEAENISYEIKFDIRYL